MFSQPGYTRTVESEGDFTQAITTATPTKKSQPTGGLLTDRGPDYAREVIPGIGRVVVNDRRHNAISAGVPPRNGDRRGSSTVNSIPGGHS